MPVAPYAQTKVREAAVDTTQANVRTTSETFVPDLSPAAKLLEGIAVEERKRVDTTRSMEADSALIKFESDLQYNKDTGYRNKRGKDAETVVADTLGMYDKASGEIEAQLTSDEQRARFRERVTQRRAALNGDLQKYSFDERERYTAETQAAYISNEQTAAAQGAADLASPDNILAGQARDRIRASMSRQIDTLAEEATRQGKSIAWFHQETLKLSSKLHSEVLGTLIDTGNSEIVSRYFDANKDSMLPADAARATKAVAESTFRGKAQSTFDDIVASSGSIEKQLAKASKLKEPELRDEVTRRLQDKLRLDNALEREQNDNVFLEAVNTVEKQKDVSAVSPAIWATLDINQRNSLHAMVDRIRGGAINGKDGGDSGTETWLKFLDMPAAEKARLTPAQFSAQFRPLLGDAEFKRATTEWNNAREAARSPKPGALSNMQSDSDIVKGAYTLGISKPSDKWSSDEKLEYIKFTDDVASQVNTLEEQKGKKATTEEKQKIANKLMSKVYIKKSFLSFDSLSADAQLKLAEVKPEDVSAAYVPIKDIPDADIGALANLLRSYGLAQKTESTTALRLRLSDRIERAYAAIQLGQSRAAVTAILKGSPQ